MRPMRSHELDMLIQIKLLGGATVWLISMSQEEFDQDAIRALGSLMDTDDAEAVKAKLQELRKKYPVAPNHLVPELDKLIEQWINRLESKSKLERGS